MKEAAPYTPDRRLGQAYHEANHLNEEGLAAICPSYIELAETDLRYREHSLIGQGSLKNVWKCWDCRAHRWVAMARLREDRGPEFYDLFVNEAWVSSSLTHPNIIKVHDVGLTSQGQPFFTMDLKGEGTLADLIQQPERDLRRLLGIFLKVCDAIAYAHEKGVLHLDLKPENIQAERFGEVIVCDWGLAKLLDDPDPDSDDFPFPDQVESIGNVTLFGEIKGTPGYMAPEQILPGRQKDERTDVFALGCLLHAILTGEPPFSGVGHEQGLAPVPGTPCDRDAKRTTSPHLPESLNAVYRKACRPQPEERYPSVLALAKEVEKYLHGFATEAEEPHFLRALSLFLRRHRLPATITLVALIALTTFAALSLQHINAERTRADSLASKVETYGQSEKHQSQQLASAAGTLKNLGVFRTPARSISEARDLAALALTLDPGNEFARHQLFSISLIQLDFQSALAYAPGPEHPYSDYLALAEAFPHYSYNSAHRPSPAELASFIRQARLITPHRGPLMERILSYDFSLRSHRDPEPVLALIEYLNGGSEQCRTTYQDRTLTIESKGDLHLRLAPGSGSGDCILKYLAVRDLRLSVAGCFNVTQLSRLPLKTLDLSQCPNLRLRRPVVLPLLKSMKIPPQPISTKEWKYGVHTLDRWHLTI
ncbi:MAG: serine/threonine-protein kinase [Verrucomicrobiota bacterium JB023]|nr:serine/threonine-protein kinase [Verrucomicrobiota bacterium JB023]